MNGNRYYGVRVEGAKYGVGFGSAGVHIPHSCAYPIASLKHEYQPPGYPDDHPFVPHGHSVIVTAPAAFASPTRPLRSATTTWPGCSPARRSRIPAPTACPTSCGG